MIDALAAVATALASAVFERVVLPVVYGLGLMLYVEDAYAATVAAVLGVGQLVLALAVLRPLEWAIPAERWADRRAVRPDVIYTLLDRLGLTTLLFFVTLRPLADRLEAAARRTGYIPPQLEDLLPWLAGQPLLALAAYVVILDLADYAYHRLQHRLGWLWALHATHHSQRQLTFWADDRNHLLDSVLLQAWRAGVALLIGVPGAAFAAATFLGRFVEQLSHANVRLGFGRLGERLLVGPRYHRAHHAIGVGHEGPAGGSNFAALFPVWDLLFRTAHFPAGVLPTGIRDQLEGADYGRGFLDQQVAGVRRLWRAIVPEAPMSAMRLLLATVLVLLAAAPASAQIDRLLRGLPSGVPGGTPGAGLPDDKVISGLKQALQVGTENTVNLTGKTGGYFLNEAIKILMPEKLRTLEKGLRTVGYGPQVDEFVLSMNRAAERAAPQAKSIFWDAITAMSFDDARKILGGGDTAATQYFQGKTTTPLTAAFTPIVQSAMNEVGVTRQYNELLGRARAIPFFKTEDYDLDRYVVGKSLDGLFHVLGEQERQIRTNPAARVTDLLKEVFSR